MPTHQEPAIPAVLAGVVLGFNSLDNYHFKPRSVIRHVQADYEPDFTSYITGNTFVAPADFATIYDLNALYSNGIDGTGQKIAVMGQTDIEMSDITTFRTLANLPANNPTVILNGTDPGTSSADISEADLDLEWSGAVAKNGTIIYVNSTDAITKSLYYAIDQDLAPVLSVSYGDCEANWGSTNLNTLEQITQLANSQGQTIVAAAGDSGAADCDSSTSTTIVTSATHGLAVDAPASDPDVTGMGGTEFNEGAGDYWSPAPNGADVSPSALSYIPEVAWNDTSTTNGLLAGGGGASTFFNTKPTWQTGPGVPNDNTRDVPDLSLNASPIHDGLLICSQGNCMNGYRLVSSDPTTNNTLTVVGGTSAAAPTFAGIVALINQQYPNTPPGQGNINTILYPMAVTSPAAFHDITTGNNIVPCTAGTPDCPSIAPLQIGFNAGVGYDQASGLGSIDAYNLVTAWGSAGTGNLPAPTLTAPATGATAVPSTPTFSWTAVTGAAGYQINVATSPTSLTTNPTATCSGCVTTTTTSYTPATALAANTLYYWQVQALVPTPGSGTAAWSTAFVFNTGTPDFSLSVSPSSLTISPGSSGTTTLTLTPIDNFIPANATLSCTLASTLAGVTCSVGSMGGNGTATITLTASSSATSYPALPRNPRLGGWWVAAVAPLLCLLLIALRKLRPRGVPIAGWNFRHVALGAVLAALLSAGLSCGGSSSGGGTTTATGESGTVTITGTSTSATHTAQISVTVS